MFYLKNEVSYFSSCHPLATLKFRVRRQNCLSEIVGCPNKTKKLG
jgi:hypothetical protein